MHAPRGPRPSRGSQTPTGRTPPTPASSAGSPSPLGGGVTFGPDLKAPPRGPTMSWHLRYGKCVVPEFVHHRRLLLGRAREATQLTRRSIAYRLRGMVAGRTHGSGWTHICEEHTRCLLLTERIVFCT